MNELLFAFITVSLGILIAITPIFEIDNSYKVLINTFSVVFLILIISVFLINGITKETEIKCLKGNFTYKQVIKYESKQIKDSIGNDKIIYLPVDTTYIKK